MNKMKIAALVGSYALAASAASMTLWNGEDGQGKVSTGGYWFKYDDNAETGDSGPGKSTSDFPTGSTLKDVVGPWFLEKGGMLDVIFTINPTTYLFPFAGVGFNWVDPEGVHDISAQTGLCVDYSITGTTVPIQAEIKLPKDATTGKPLDGDNARALKMKTSAVLGTPTLLPFATFTQEDNAKWYGKEVSVADALKNSSGIKFKAQLKTPPTAAQTVNLKIKSVGWANECGSAPVLSNAAAAGVKMALTGRTLSFNGLSSSATVEVINMQGQRISSQVLGAKKSVSLSGLSNGMYMVRVAGESVNFSQRIVLQ